MARRAVYAAPWMQNGGAIVRIDGRTGSATTLVRDGGNVHAGVSSDKSHIYWSANAEVRRYPKVGGEVEVVGAGPGPTADRIAIDDDAVYWSSGTVVMSRSKSGGAAVEVGRSDAEPVRGLVAGNRFVYWLTDTALVRQNVTMRQPPVIHRRAEKRFSPAPRPTRATCSGCPSVTVSIRRR